jgi:hypothetical protein
MPKRSSRKNTPKDANELAAFIVREATNTAEGVENEKNPHAVALGRLGGLKGGKVRAERLTEDQRQDIARRAAQVRWSRREKENGK